MCGDVQGLLSHQQRLQHGKLIKPQTVAIAENGLNGPVQPQGCWFSGQGEKVFHPQD